MFKEIFKNSLKIIWQNPSWWFLGFFSSFSPVNEFLIPFFLYFFLVFSTQEKIVSLPEIKTLSLLPPHLIIISSFVIIFFLLLAIFSEILLILLIKKATEGNLENLTKKIFSYLGKVLLLKFFLYLFLVLDGIILVFLFKRGVNYLIFLFLLLLLINLIILFIFRYAIFYLVLENNKFFLSLKNASLIFKKNWLKTFGIYFFIFLITGIYIVLTTLLSSSGAFTYPLRFFTLILVNILGKYGFWLMALFTSLLTFILQIVIVGFIFTYQIACWFFLFSKIRKECE